MSKGAFKAKIGWLIFFQLVLVFGVSYLENKCIISQDFVPSLSVWLMRLTFLSWGVYFCYQLVSRIYRGLKKKALYQELFEGMSGLLLIVILVVVGIILAVYLYLLYRKCLADVLQLSIETEFIKHFSLSTFAMMICFIGGLFAVDGQFLERCYVVSLGLLFVTPMMLLEYLTTGITAKGGRLLFASYWESTDPHKNYLILAYVSMILISGLLFLIERYFSKRTKQ